MSSQLHALKDYKTRQVDGYLDLATGVVYADAEGLKRVRQLELNDFLAVGNNDPLRDEHGRMVHVSALANVAAEAMYSPMAKLIGRAPRVAQLDEAGRLAYDKDGRLITMDLAPSDVHQPAAISNFAGGYRISDDGIADAMSPVVIVPKQSDYYYVANSDNDFKRKLPVGGAPGAHTGEVNPAYTATQFTVKQFTLSGFLPTEVMANADAPLKPMQKLTQMIADAHRLEREIRVATLLQTSASFNSNNVTTLAAGSQWDGGATSDPIANLHHLIEQSFMPVTAIAMSEIVFHDFVRNPAVQKFFTYKDPVTGLPTAAELSKQLALPTIYVSTMRYSVGGAATQVWGDHVVLIHQPKEMPPTTQLDVATSQTFRWNGGLAPDGTITGGLLLRSYFDPKRGARGGNTVVMVMEDTEVMTSSIVGGLLLNAHL